MDELSRFHRVFRAVDDGRGEDRHLLRALGQLPDDGDPRDRTQFADLLEADFHITAREGVTDSLARVDHLSSPGLLSNAEPRKKNGAQVDAAGAVGDADRPWSASSVRFERVDRADVRLRRAGADGHAR